MNEPSRQLTIDEAIGEFDALLREQTGDDLHGDCEPPATQPETQEEADARHFRIAEHLVGLACPDPATCGDPRCRRDTLCRHLAHVRTRQANRKSSHPRRPPGADALRYAIWVFMSSRRGEG